MGSVQLRLLFFSLSLFLVEKSVSAAFMQSKSCAYHKPSQILYEMIGQYNVSSSSSVLSILEFLYDHIEELQFAKYQKIIFVMGADDSDKISLISLVTDATLEAVETPEISCVFKIVDKDGPLNNYAPNIVSELIPQLLTDKLSGVDYYVLPSFNLPTDVRYDLTAWHLIQKSLQYATGVKFLLTLASPPREINPKHVSSDAIESVKYLVRKTTSLINDIEKYSEAISLTVTKVKNYPKNSDVQEIENVAHMLRVTKIELVEEFDASTDIEDSNALNKDIRLLEILLLEDRGYKRISIMRLANEAGPISGMTALQKEKVDITYMVRNNIKYVRSNVNSFSFNILNETRILVPGLTNEMQKRVLLDISNIGNLVKNIYETFEENLFDLDVLLKKIEEGYEAISQIYDSDPRTIVQQISIVTNALKLEIPSGKLDGALKHVDLYYFLVSLNGHHRENLFSIGVADTTKYLNETKIWYNFVLNLHESLSGFDVQKHVKEYENITATLIQQCTIDKHKEIKVNDIGLKFYLTLIGIEMDPQIEHMTVNSYKLQKLKNVLYRTMIDHGTQSCSENKISVQGYNLIFSDVLKMECEVDITIREILAMNNLFIDADINEDGKDLQLTIIAPKWEIIGNRSITLKGQDGQAHNETKALGGTRLSTRGSDGLPGHPGLSAGLFFAIGNKFINDEHLQVRLRGGKGN